MGYLDWSHTVLLSFSCSAGHSVFSQESIKQYFKINIFAVIPEFKTEQSKYKINRLQFTNGHSKSQIHLFLLSVLKETIVLKEILCSSVVHSFL